jgi:hypothetical protein
MIGKIMMNIRNVKTIVLSVMLSVFLLITVNANAQEVFEKSDSTIDLLDNTNGIVVIEDQEYKLKLNTKVYSSKKKLLNRYALKVGQIIAFEAERENGIMYLNYIVIQK